MTARVWILVVALVLGNNAVSSAQGLTLNERLVQLADILGNGSLYKAPAKIRAIEEIAGLDTTSGLASGLLFDRANFQ
jgi:hypothetical protein